MMRRYDSALPALLTDFAEAFAGLLGLRLLRLAGCCRACRGAFDGDPRIWAALLQYEIDFRTIRKRDAAAASIIKRLPKTAKHLSLNLCETFWKRREDSIRDETVRLLVQNLPPALHTLSINLLRPQCAICGGLGPELARSLPTKLRKLVLLADLSRDASLAVMRSLPPTLTELTLHIGDSLKWDKEVFRCFAEGFPRQLRTLDFEIDGDLRGLAPLAERLAASELTTLRFCLGTVEGSEALAEFLAALPASLTELQLQLCHIEMSHRCCEELGRCLRRLTELNDLELALSSACSVRRALQAQCKNLSFLELSLGALAPADTRQLVSFVNAGSLQRLGLILEGSQPEASRLMAALPSCLEELELFVSDRAIGAEALLALARGLPPRLQALALTFSECEVTTESIQEMMGRLPHATLLSLSLDFSWASFSQLTECNFPKKLRQLHLSSRPVALEMPTQTPLVPALARELPGLTQLRSLTLDFEGCSWMAASAQQVLSVLPPLNRLEADFGPSLSQGDSLETWQTLLAPFRARYRASIRMPGAPPSSQTLYEAFRADGEDETEAYTSDDDLST